MGLWCFRSFDWSAGYGLIDVYAVMISLFMSVIVTDMVTEVFSTPIKWEIYVWGILESI